MSEYGKEMPQILQELKKQQRVVNLITAYENNTFKHQPHCPISMVECVCTPEYRLDVAETLLKEIKKIVEGR